MDRALLSTAYFPPIAYFSCIIQSPGILIEKEENYHKQTYRNRCVILGANGPLNLTVPVQHGPEPKIPITNLKIAYHNNWQTIHHRAIESAYRNSPFYEFYIDELMVFFEQKPETLLELNNKILTICLNILGYKEGVDFTREYLKEGYQRDYRSLFTPKKRLTTITFPEYQQVFCEKFGFISNLSILDLIFNAGPESIEILKNIKLL